jgi:hypothetical protein
MSTKTLPVAEQWIIDASDWPIIINTVADGPLSVVATIPEPTSTLKDSTLDAAQVARAHLLAAAPELRDALAALYEHCSMVHRHWGEGSNQKQADAAIAAGRALLERLK